MTTVPRWAERKLGSVARLYAGGTLPEGEPFEAQQDGHLLLRVSDMNLPGNEVFLKNARLWSSGSGARSATCPPGSLVIPKRGGAIGTNKKRITTRPCILDPNLMAIAPTDELDIRFLYQWFLTFDLTGIANGSSVPQLNKKDLNPLLLPLPPIDVQRQIAAKLDAASAMCASRRMAISLIDTLAGSIFLDMFGDPVDNPLGWDEKSLTDACYCYSGGTPSKAREDLWVGSLPWFSPKDLKKGDLFDSQDHISESVPQESNIRLLPPNTVAIVVRGMILRHTFPVSVLRVSATINQDLKALFPRESLEAQFLATCLRVQSAHVLQQVSTAAHGTGRLDSEGLGKIRVILPPANLRTEFANRVASVERLARAHHSSLVQLEALLASLQDRAFGGEL